MLQDSLFRPYSVLETDVSQSVNSLSSFSRHIFQLQQSRRQLQSGIYKIYVYNSFIDHESAIPLQQLKSKQHSHIRIMSQVKIISSITIDDGPTSSGHLNKPCSLGKSTSVEMHKCRKFCKNMPLGDQKYLVECSKSHKYIAP